MPRPGRLGLALILASTLATDAAVAQAVATDQQADAAPPPAVEAQAPAGGSADLAKGAGVGLVAGILVLVILLSSGD